MKISTNTFVAVSYDLNVENDLMERATAETPLEFIFGTGMMLPAFEEKLENLAQGSAFDFQLSPENAYGEYDDNYVAELPRDMFEQDGALNEDFVKPGQSIPMMDEDGNRMNGTVVEVGETIILMDFNHPLAGKTLNFKGEVLVARDATAEELAELFAARQGGGCGSGCSCGSEEESSCGSGGCGSGCSC